MKKDMLLEGLRWSRDSGSALYDTPQNGRSRTGWGVRKSMIALYPDSSVIIAFIFVYFFRCTSEWFRAMLYISAK